MRTPATLFLVSAVAVAQLACSASNDGPPPGSGASGTTGTAGDGGAGAGGGSSSSGSGGQLEPCGDTSNLSGVELSPPTATVEILDGQLPAPIDFAAIGLLQHCELTDGKWSFDRPDLGTIDSQGVLVLGGKLGGIGTVTYQRNSFTATAKVTVKLHVTSNPAGADDALKASFGDAKNADPALTLLYPYDDTVFPRGLDGPMLQWDGGAPGDVYYVHLVSPTFEYEAWTSAPPPSRYAFPQVPLDVWRTLTGSTVGDVEVNVQRHSGAEAFLPKKQTWHVAPANLTGIVYYHEAFGGGGDVVRLKVGAGSMPEKFLQSPSGECIGCHSISKDGSRLVGSHTGAVKWAVFDTATGQPLFDSATSSGFQAIAPDGSHVVWRDWADINASSTGALTLSAANSTVSLAELVAPPGGFPARPVWSGDGTKIAYSVRTDGNGSLFTHSSLWLTGVDLLLPSFTNPTPAEIVAGDASRPTVTYPTFSPDSQWIAFQRSTQVGRGWAGELWLTDASGQNQIPLEAASGAFLAEPGQSSATFEPTFLPVSVGGYNWLIAISERKYGNTMVDTNPTTRRRQLWISAIDMNPTPGQDPSHPGFWLPGQNVDANNLRGAWALSPCKPKSESCEAGYDCCEGFCIQKDDGTKTCGTPEGCSQIGDKCATAADCCDPAAVCSGGFCALVDVPK